MTRYVKARAGWYWHVLRWRYGKAETCCTGTPLAKGYTTTRERPAEMRCPTCERVRLRSRK